MARTVGGREGFAQVAALAQGDAMLEAGPAFGRTLKTQQVPQIGPSPSCFFFCCKISMRYFLGVSFLECFVCMHCIWLICPFSTFVCMGLSDMIQNIFSHHCFYLFITCFFPSLIFLLYAFLNLLFCFFQHYLSALHLRVFSLHNLFCVIYFTGFWIFFFLFVLDPSIVKSMHFFPQIL